MYQERHAPEPGLPRSTFDAARALEDLADGFIALDAEYRFLYINAAGERINGVRRQEILGRNNFDVFPEALGTPIETAFRRAMTERVTVDTEVFLEPWGRWFAIRTSPGPDGGIQAHFREITEQRAAEERVRLAQELLPDALTLLRAQRGPDGRIVDFVWEYANAAAGRILRHAPDSLVGSRLLEVLSGNLENRALFQRYVEIVETGRPSTTELFYDSDGIRGWFRNTTVKLGDGVAVSFQDITERREAEEALRRQEAEFRGLFELSAVGVAQADPVTARFVRVNPRFCEITGYSEAELLRLTYLDLTHPEDREADQRLTRPVLRGEADRWESEKRYRCADGSEKWVHVSGRMLRDADGKPYRTLASVVDVTERKRAEQAVRESEERLRRAQRAAHLGTWEWDLRNDRITWSEGIYELLGLAPGSFVPTGDGWTRFLLAEDRKTAGEAVQAALARGGEFTIEFRVRRSDGAVRWLASIGRVEAGPDGTSARMLGVNIDITGRKEAELALREADQRKDEFLAMLAHELRNPLAPIRTAVRILRMQGPQEPQLQRQRAVIERQVENMAHLLDDLLDVSRVTRGMVRLRRRSLELTEVAKEALEASRSVLEERGHSLRLLPAAEPLPIRGDRLRLEQVVMNLLSNAAKYTPPGGTITLRTGSEGGQAVLTVSDTGRGISPALLPHVFELFFQGERGLSRSEGGLGIGLTLVRRLVELHGGGVEARSPGPGQGSEFVVRLPLARESEPPDPPHEDAAPGAPEHSHGPVRVLVVDDLRDNAETLAEILGLWGYQADTAVDGAAALELAAKIQPQAVFLDIGMPGMDGYEAARRLRRVFSPDELLLVALTGYGQDQDRQRALEAGFDEHLMKPVDPDRIREVLARRFPARPAD